MQIGLNDLSSKFKKCTLSRNELDNRRLFFFFFVTDDLQILSLRPVSFCCLFLFFILKKPLICDVYFASIGFFLHY